MSLKSTLEWPAVYLWLQRVLGGDSVHRHVVENHIRPRPGDRILDIGCGPAQILTHLADIEYVGVDLNPRYIASARNRFGHRGTFLCQSVSEMLVDQPHSFDRVIAHGLIHHLDDVEAGRLFEIAATALKPGGCFVTVDGCFVPGQSPVARLMLRNDRGKHVRSEDGYLALARRAFNDVRPTIRHDLLRSPYTHLILECRNEASVG